ncbi:OmpA family protein [Bradyrhizobium sp. Ai1a-2]|uniref:OmpA family protein n=1 Tax=Bradyrhizobium sp. Ai1a-2 TaxID=196490 RepID=UPI000421BE5F|nr:OmpA family protein [Bradyrhizobium sp. Ai1a-2]
MTSYFEFEAIPEIGEFPAQEFEEELAEGEIEQEYARRRWGAGRAPSRYVRGRRPSRPPIKPRRSWPRPPFGRRRRPPYEDVPPSFPVIPWRGSIAYAEPPVVLQDEPPPAAPAMDEPQDQPASGAPDTADAQADAPAADTETFEYESAFETGNEWEFGEFELTGEVPSNRYVRDFSGPAAECVAALRTAGKTKAQALAIINAQIDTAIKMLRTAASKLKQGGRSAATRQTFLKIFRVTPEFTPTWLKQTAEIKDRGDVVAVRCKRVADLLASGRLKLFCQINSTNCPDCGNDNSDFACSSWGQESRVPGRSNVICLGNAFWRDMKAGRTSSLLATLMHEPFHIYFGRYVTEHVADRGKFGGINCIVRFVFEANGRNAPDRVNQRCTAMAVRKELEAESPFGEFETLEFEAPAAMEFETAVRMPSPGAVPCPGLKLPEVIDKFEFDRDRLLPPHLALLQRIAQCIVATQSTGRPVRQVRVVGHTDPVGDDAYNLALGRRRAEQVKLGLQKAIEGLRPVLAGRIDIRVETAGEGQPIAGNAAASRRVEIFVEIPFPVRPPPPPRPRVTTIPRQCRFRSTVHGLKFVNSFALPSAITTPLSRLGIPIGSGGYGLCGGMSSLVGDHFTFGVPIPATTSIPATGSALHTKLVSRQLDSLNLNLSSIGPGFGAPVLKFFDWMGRPTSGAPNSTAALTTLELARVIARLRRGQVVVIGLVLVDRTGSLTENHQVLVHCATLKAPGLIELHIYDPNFPMRNDIRIEVKTVSRETTPTELVGSTRRPIRGFFVMPFTPQRP